MQMRQIDLTQRKCKSENIFSIKKNTNCYEIAIEYTTTSIQSYQPPKFGYTASD